MPGEQGVDSVPTGESDFHDGPPVGSESMPREVPQPGYPGSRPGPARIALLVLASLVLALAAGCGRELRDKLAPNQRPTVRLTYAPVDTTQREFYVYRMYWTGFDADGRMFFLVDRQGEVVERFAPATTPSELAARIEALL